MKQSEAGASRRDNPLWLRAAMLFAAPLSGVLLCLCFPPYNAHFLAWTALVPLLWSVTRTTPRGAVLRGYLFGVAYLGLLLWWFSVVRYPAVIGYLVMCVLLPIILFAPWAWAVNRLLTGKRKQPAVLVCACLWILLEWLVSQGTFAFPWWVLGNTQVKNLVAAQAASIGGVYLVSFEILIVNLFIYSLIERRVKAEKAVWLFSGVVLISLLLYGALEMSRGQVAEEPVTLALIQPDYPYEFKDDDITFVKVFETHIDMTVKAVGEKHPDIVVWSESVAFKKWLTGPMYIESTKDMLNRLNTMLVAGVYENEDGNQYNALTVIDPDQGELGKYRKMQTVPFGEAFPYRKQIESISPRIGEWIKENVFEFDITAGTEYTVFDTRHGKFAALICFESVIPEIARKMVGMGAEYIFIVTNDAWSPSPTGVYQHAMIGMLRAIENRRYVVHAANGGLSYIIDPYGRVVARAPISERTVLYGTVYPESGKTFYTRFGEWFCAVCFVFVIGFFAVSRFKRKKKE